MKSGTKNLLVIGGLLVFVLAIVFLTGGGETATSDNASSDISGNKDTGMEMPQDMQWNESMVPPEGMNESFRDNPMDKRTLDFDTESCEGLNEGESCTTEMMNETIDGICQTFNEELVCMPEMVDREMPNMELPSQ